MIQTIRSHISVITLLTMLNTQYIPACYGCCCCYDNPYTAYSRQYKHYGQIFYLPSTCCLTNICQYSPYSPQVNVIIVTRKNNLVENNSLLSTTITWQLATVVNQALNIIEIKILLHVFIICSNETWMYRTICGIVIVIFTKVVNTRLTRYICRQAVKMKMVVFFNFSMTFFIFCITSQHCYTVCILSISSFTLYILSISSFIAWLYVTEMVNKLIDVARYSSQELTGFVRLLHIVLIASLSFLESPVFT